MKITPQAQAALDQLHAAITSHLDKGRPVPCVGDTEWISEDREELEAAAHRCDRCPVLEECRTAARAIKPTSGVWAGRSYGPRSSPTSSESDGASDPGAGPDHHDQEEIP